MDLRRQIRILEGSEIGENVSGSEQIGRIQNLERERAILRNENQELQREKDLYQSTAHSLSGRVEELQKLIQSLEVRNLPSPVPTESNFPTLDLIAIGRSIDQFTPLPSHHASEDALHSTEKETIVPSLLEITTAQRQELRGKILEVEQVREKNMREQSATFSNQDRDHWKDIANRETLRCSRLHENNLTLSERIQNLQVQSNSEAQLSKLDYEGHDSDVELGYDGGIGARLRGKEQYSKIHIPEGLRKLSNLTQIERVIVTFGSAILSTRVTRVGLLCYCLLLHLLVMISLHARRC